MRGQFTLLKRLKQQLKLCSFIILQTRIEMWRWNIWNKNLMLEYLEYLEKRILIT